MPRHIKYSEEQRQFAGQAREVAMNRDVLYHGTRYAQSILKTRVLFHSLTGGDPKVCLTRSAEVAAYWAMIDRDEDEGRGSIFIFDRQSLERRYKIEANPEVYWHTNRKFHDEAEENIWDNVVDLGDHLIGVVSDPTLQRPPKSRKLISTSRTELKRRRRTEIEARLLNLAIPKDANGVINISKFKFHAQPRSHRSNDRRPAQAKVQRSEPAARAGFSLGSLKVRR